MLAIPRIQAVPEGANSAARPKIADRAISGSNAFVKVLSSLIAPKMTAGLSGTSRGPAAGDPAAGGRKPGKTSADLHKNTDAHTNAAVALASAPHGAAAGAAATAAAGRLQQTTKTSADGDAARAGQKLDIRKSNRGLAADDMASTVMAARTHVLAEPAMTRGASGTSGRQGANGAGSSIETIGTGTETRANGTKVSVVDLRLKAARKEAGADGGDGGDGGDGAGGTRQPAGESTHQATVPDHGDIGAGARLGAGIGAGAGTGSPSAVDTSPRAAASHGSFADSLAARLRDGAADIVRSAQVVLRNGDVGLIRMRLEPETLGGVKIELKMAEKQISGRIIVESDIAGEAFRSSIDALKDAFAESGFDVRSLEVEVRNGMASGNGTDGRNADRGSSGTAEGPYWSRSLRELDAAVPAVSRSGRAGLLNVLV